MGRVNTPILSESAKLALEHDFKTSQVHSYRMRCQVILLKSTGRKSQEVGEITGMTYVSVNAWVKRYKDFGIEGLQTQPGRGRKRILDKETDKESILKSVKANRQRIQTAKAEWEKESGRSVSLSTLKVFLKALTDDTNE
ncbi:MAG: helix-turn-helix domain-containing protein [Spirosomataceae bacterium]|jgi:transposase